MNKNIAKVTFLMTFGILCWMIPPATAGEWDQN